MFRQEVIYGNDNLELSVSCVKLSSTHNAVNLKGESDCSFIRRKNTTINFNSVRRNSFFACTTSQYSQPIDFDTDLKMTTDNLAHRFNSTLNSATNRSICSCYKTTEVSINFLTSTPKPKTYAKNSCCADCLLCKGSTNLINTVGLKSGIRNEKSFENKKSFMLLSLNDYFRKLLKRKTKTASHSRRHLIKSRNQFISSNAAGKNREEKKPISRKGENLKEKLPDRAKSIDYKSSKNNIGHKFSHQKFSQLGQLQIWYV